MKAPERPRFPRGVSTHYSLEMNIAGIAALSASPAQMAHLNQAGGLLLLFTIFSFGWVGKTERVSRCEPHHFPGDFILCDYQMVHAMLAEMQSLLVAMGTRDHRQV